MSFGSFSGGEIYSLHTNKICTSALDLQLWLNILWDIQPQFSILEEPSILLSNRMVYFGRRAHYVLTIVFVSMLTYEPRLYKHTNTS